VLNQKLRYKDTTLLNRKGLCLNSHKSSLAASKNEAAKLRKINIC